MMNHPRREYDDEVCQLGLRRADASMFLYQHDHL